MSFIQLPNKDLWKGRPADVVELAPETEVVPEASQDPTNRAMAQILKAAAGARELTCLWCGMQSDERSMRVHLKASHRSVTEPMGASEAALATLAVAQKAVMEAKAAAE